MTDDYQYSYGRTFLWCHGRWPMYVHDDQGFAKQLTFPEIFQHALFILELEYYYD